MDWVVNLSFNSLNGDLSAIKTLNLLIKDWILNNLHIKELIGFVPKKLL